MPEILETNVKIKADASSLKKETNESVSALERLKNAWSSVQEKFSKPVKPRLDTSEYTAQIKDLENQIASLSSLIDSEWGRKDLGTEGVDKIRAKIEQLNNRMEALKRKQDEVASGWDKGSSGLTKLINKVKRVALSLMGIRTVFSLISKGMNTYLSQNDALREKLNGIYYAIGSMLAPILEWMVNLFAKIVLYVNAFLKGLGFAGIQFKSITNGAKKTQKSMEKVKTIISGFDELNIFSKQATDNAEETANALADPFADVDVNQEWMEKLYDWGQKLKPILDWIVQKCKEIWDWIVKHKELVLAIAAILGGIAIASKIGDILSKLKVIWDVLKTIGGAITSFLTSPLGGVALIIAGLITSITAFVDMWKNGWTLIGEIIKDIGIALVAIGAVILGAPATVAAAVAGIVAVLSTLAIVIHEHWDEISAWLKEKWEHIKEEAKASWEALTIIIQYCVQRTGEIISELWTSFTEWLKECWTNIKSIAQELWTAISNTINDIVKKLSDFLKTSWEGIKNTASAAWNNIKSILTSIMQSIYNFFVSSWNAIKNTVINVTQSMANAITNIWNGIVNTIKGCVNGIVGFINKMISAVVSGINGVINILNKFSVNIPDWVPGLGGKKFGFNIKTISAPKLSYLANGGVIKNPTLAMMGEYQNAGRNPEIVTPQNLLQDMLNSNNAELVNAFAQMTSQIITAINNVDMEVKIGDDTIARSAARGNNSYKSMTGRSLITA